MFCKNEEKMFFLNYLKKTDRLLEYGSGESTNIISDYVNEIVSVEHNLFWFEKINKVRKNNVTLIYKPVDTPYTEGGHDGTYAQFKSYVEAPLLNGKFDVVLIDGRARIECFKFVKNVINNNALIFVHDFFTRIHSDGYGEMFKFGNLIASEGEMALFKINI